MRETLSITDRAYIINEGTIGGRPPGVIEKARWPEPCIWAKDFACSRQERVCDEAATGSEAQSKLIMTPQLQQAIKLLQLSRLELQQSLQQHLMENPCWTNSSRRPKKPRRRRRRSVNSGHDDHGIRRGTRGSG